MSLNFWTRRDFTIYRLEMKIKNIIFDFDWVIHDTLEDLHKVYSTTLEKISMKDMLLNVFSWNSREYAKKFSNNQINNFEKEWSKVMSDLEIEKNIENNLKNLKNKFNLFIISSNTEKNLNNYFFKNNLENLFDEILWKETHFSKFEKFNILFDKYNFNNKSCVFITDTLWDILEANSLGIKTIAVDFWYHKRDILEKWNPYKIVSCFDEIEYEINKIK